MSTQQKYCILHPTKLAHWRCSNCDSDYCPSCTLKQDKGGYLCPKCSSPTDWIGADNTLVPFWNRLPKFFVYPFSLGPMILISVLSFAETIFSGLSFFGLLIDIVIYGTLLKYSYAVLKITARGNMIPPGLDYQTFSQNFFHVFKQILIFVIIGIVFEFFATEMGPFVGYAFLMFALLSVPAMIIIFVITESILKALNPFVFVKLAFRIGWGYLTMYFFLVILLTAPAILAEFVVPVFPSVITRFFVSLFTNYYTIISYHLMGYVILQYHENIGYKIEFEDFKEADATLAETTEDPDANLLTQINILLKEGKTDDALLRIREQTKDRKITNLTVSERYYTLLKMKKQAAEMIVHAPTHLELLTQDNRKKDACTIYSECLSSNPNFTPSSSALFKIGGWLNENGNSKGAITALNKLAKNYPQDPLIPKAYFRAAQIFHDRLMNPSKAKQILTTILKKYPEHDIIPQVRNYLAHIGGSGATSSA